MHGKDADYYRVEIPKAGQYAVTFQHEYIETSDNRWKVTVFNADNAETGSFSVKGKETRSSFGFQMNAGYCYIKVENYYSSSSSSTSAAYQLTVVPE